MATKPKSVLSESPSKASRATPKVSKLSRAVTKPETDSHSPLQSRLSVDRSPQSANSKPSIDRRSPKVASTPPSAKAATTPPLKSAIPPEKPQSRVAKGSELQAQLSVVQEDLKKAKEKIELIEKEKAQAIDELKEAQGVAEEANAKLQEALMAQKHAEDNSEIEKFRAVKLEQAGIEASQKKEEEWQREIEAVRNKHALDVASLLSTTQELQRIKQELAVTTDAKKQALSHASDATKIAEMHVEKAEILSSELTRLKALLDLHCESESIQNKELVLKLEDEIDTLKQELEKCKIVETKLLEREAFIKQLNVELESAKMAQTYSLNLVDEWKARVEELEMRAEEAHRLERSASESLDSVMRQLEETNDKLHDADSEIVALTVKVGLLEMTTGRQKRDLDESERRLGMVMNETSEVAKTVESLKSELDTVKEEKAQALNNEKLAASSVQNLLEEKHKLINDLENSKEEEEKIKKAMENLASALHEVSAEAREAKEQLLSSQNGHESYEAQIEDLRLVLKATNEKYESMLEDARHEIDVLTHTVNESKDEFENSKAEWEQKKLHLVDCIKKSEEENSSMEKEIKKLYSMLKKSEDACGTKEEEAQLRDSLKEVEAEVIYLQETLGQAKAESMKLKESLLEQETELRSVIQENEELQARETDSIKKVEELSRLLEEAMAKKQTEVNGELTDSEKDYDVLPKVVEFSEENGLARGEEKAKMDLLVQQFTEQKLENSKEKKDGMNHESVLLATIKIENANGKLKEDGTKEKEDDSVEVEFKMWESYKIEKELSPDRQPEPESFEEEGNSKVEGSEASDQITRLSSTENIDDGGSLPSKEPQQQQQQQKKKKPFIQKFGSLLKKKPASTPK